MGRTQDIVSAGPGPFALFYTQTSPMSYAAALEQLNAMAPELFTKPGEPRRKFSLDQVRTLLAALGIRTSAFVHF